MRSRLLLATFACVVGTSACHHDGQLTDPRTIAETLDGTWAEQFNLPGFQYEFTLAATDTTITGTGVFAGEAGPSGTLTVTGVINGQTVQLDLLDSRGLHQYFSGGLISSNELRGSFWQQATTLVSTDPIVVTFHRTSLPD